MSPASWGALAFQVSFLRHDPSSYVIDCLSRSHPPRILRGSTYDLFPDRRNRDHQGTLLPVGTEAAKA